MFRALCAYYQEVKLYYTASGIITLCRWPSGAYVPDDKHKCQSTGRPPTECDDTRCCIIQFDLLMISTECSKHVKEYNKLIIEQEIVY